MRFFEFRHVNKTPLTEGARIDHVEDLIFWQASVGAVKALNSLVELEKGGHKDVTVKWDGSPAIIFGRDEDGKFILTDKSGFGAKTYNGRAKSPGELEKMLMARPGASNPDPKKADEYRQFAGNMKDIFDEYEKAVPKDFRGYFKGDLLYYNTPPIKDGEFVFTPNIVTYFVDQNSELGQQISRSKTGIVVHRIINAEGTEGPVNIDLNNMMPGDDVVFFPSVTTSSAPQVNNSKVIELKTLINQNKNDIDLLLSLDVLESKKMKYLRDVFYNYINQTNLKTDFVSWLKNKPDVNDTKRNKIMSHIGENQKGFDATWKIVAGLQEIKNNIIDQFDKQDTGVRAVTGNTPGGEGYVMAHPTGDIKLVNRAGFTAANRAVQR